MQTQASDMERRLRRIEKTIPYLFRMNCLPGVPDCGGRAQLKAEGCILATAGEPKVNPG